MLVRENINFIRGEDPITSMGVGLDVAIPQLLQNFKKSDTAHLIDSLNVDLSYPFVYIYTAIPEEFDWENEEMTEITKQNMQKYFKGLMEKIGLDRYLDFDSNDNVDEIVYKVKLPYKKIFKKIAPDFNE